MHTTPVSRSSRRRTALIAAIAAISGAETQAQQVAVPAELAEVSITASRITQSGFVAPTPTTVLSAEAIRDSGATNIGELAEQMPQLLASIGPANASTTSGGGGNAFNLRALTAPRTLFLVNSRRHVANNPNGTTDNNVVPSAIIDRVEVVTGGASAAWGSDAVAGVVNVILRKDIDGFEGELQLGSSSHADAYERKAALAYGARFAGDRGHFLIAGEYENNSGVEHLSDRDWGRGEWGIVSNPTYTPTNGQYARLLASQVRGNDGNDGGVILSGTSAGTTFGTGGVPVNYNPGVYPLGVSRTIGGDGPATAPRLTVLVPLERHNVFLRPSYDISDRLSVFMEASASRSTTEFDLVDNFHPGGFTVTSNNAFLPQSIRTALAGAGQTSFRMGRLDTDFGPIHEVTANATRRIVGGLDGKFGATWTWTGYYQYGDNTETFDEQNILRPANFALALDAVVAPNGQIVCNSSLTTPTNGCQPINVFGFGSPSAAAIAFVTGAGHRVTDITQNTAAFSMQGQLFSTWAGPLSAAVGAEYRKDDLERTVDPLSQSNAFLIGNPKAFTGDISVRELFGELVVPLLTDKPFARELDLSLAGRYVDYSSIGGETSWKFGLSYAVNDALRFRAARSRDIRAPNLLELFSYSADTFAVLRDPVTNTTPTVRINAAPNPDLQAERADDTTIGVVYKPTWLPGLQGSVDYFRIDIDGAIASIGAQEFINRCLAGNTEFCSVITRNAQNQITDIRAGRVNLTQLLTSGVDAELQYTVGGLTLRALATYTDELSSFDGFLRTDRAGQVAAGGALASGVKPHWMANGSVGYALGALNLIANVRYVGGGKYDTTFQPLDLDIQEFSGRTYVDLGARYSLRAGQLEVFGRINNVMDRDPPIIPNPDSSFATNGALYDTVGRTFLAGARIRF